MITIRNLDFRYRRGDFRLRVPDLAIAKGERVAIVGASGSGKTTLLNLIAGILAPSSGVITVSDLDLSGLSEAGRRDFRVTRIGLIFQTFELLEYLSVRDNFLLPFRISAAVTRDADSDEQLNHLATDMGIESRLASYPDQLSQGERQRAAICRALITSPDLILADEPTGNLDPDNKQRVLHRLLEQVTNNDATLVMVTHDHDLLAPFDRVLDMRDFHNGGNM